MQTVDTKFLPSFAGFLLFGAPAASLLDMIEVMQGMLPDGPGEEYVLGKEWSIADAALTPFLMRINTMLKLNPPTLKEGVAGQVSEALQSPRFARLHNYLSDNAARPSMAKTWDEVCVA